MNQIQKDAQFYYGMGLVPIPCAYRGKTPAKGLRWKKFAEKFPPPIKIQALFSKTSRFANLAVVMRNPYVVLDIDQPDAYEEIYDDLKDTRIHKSSRGYHLWYRLQQEFSGVVRISINGKKTNDGELRGAGSIVVVPPSIHKTGVAYSILRDAPILELGGVEDLGLDIVGIPERDLYSQNRVNGNRPPLIENIKDGFKIADVLAEAGHLPIYRHQNMLSYLCPFHADTDPSFKVDLETESAFCFSPYCKAHGKALDVINVFALLYDRDNTSATGALAMELGL